MRYLFFKYICTILVLSFISSINIHTQSDQIHFKHLTREQGLSDSFDWCILQDSKGFIWIGTSDGLDRYDGRELKVYKHSLENINSLGANTIRSLYEDRKGTLWVGTGGGGLNRYNSAQENFTRYANDPYDSNSISSNVILSIFEDKSGTLWVGTINGGLNIFDRKTERFIHFNNNANDPTSISSNSISSILEDSKGNLWIGTTGGGLNKFDRRKQNFIRFVHNPFDPTSLSDNDVTAICEDSRGKLWISTMGGGLNKLNFIDENHQPVFTHFKNNPEDSYSINNNDIYTIYIDQENILWVGSWGGGLSRTISRTDLDSSPLFISYTNDPDDPFSLSNNNISCIYKDNSGLLWVATWGGGLHIHNTKQKQFRHFKHEPQNPFSLSANGVTTIYEDKTGTLWVGTWEGGLNKMDRSTNKFIHYKHETSDPTSLSDNAISAIYEDGSGVLWVGTWNGGLNKFNKEKEKFYYYKNDPRNPKSISDNRITAISEDKSGNMWIGTYYGGLNKFERESESFKYFKREVDNPNSISDNLVATIYKDKGGMLWVGTKFGTLDALNSKNEKFIHYSFNTDNSKSFSPHKITSIHEDKSGIIWVGTQDRGLIKLNKETRKFRVYMMKDGLPNDYILGILEDNSGNLWLSTNYGISKFNPLMETFRNYDVDDGLQSNEFEELSSYCRSKTGELIFGGTNGFNVFYPDSIKDNPHIPPIVITDFYLFNEPVSIGYDSLSNRSVLQKSVLQSESIELNYDDKILSFEFAALDFHSPEKNRYAYIMEGFDKDWTYTDANRRLATYTNLDPGEYIFRVRGSNNDGIWNEKGASIKIIILPPWWRTKWAYILYVLFIASIIYLTWKAQLKRLRVKHEFEMSRFETQKLHEVDEIKSRFFTNISHEFRTPLTLILGPVKQIIERIKDEKTKDELRIVHKNANKLLGLVNQLLDISKLESGNMKLQTIRQNIIPFLKALVMSFTSYAERKRITLKFNSSEDEIIVFIDKDKIEKIITNILSNAFKFTPEGGRIEVTVKPKPSSFPTLVKGELKGDFVEISIRDTGIGIPKEKMSKIFDRFYQVDGSHTREQEGTGIGLALTKELVELHKGKIEVESEEGKGTTLTISISLGKEHLKPEEINECQEDEESLHFVPTESIHFDETSIVKPNLDILTQTEKPLLLIVEDNLDVRNYIKDNLKNDFRALEAIDGEDGWNKSVENIPDLIVSDIMMPKMDGFELCNKLKTDERTSHIPVILLTAKASSTDKIEGFETGADDYIMKPFVPGELKARIKNLIEQRKRVHQHFKKNGIFELNQTKITSVDKKFLQRAFDIIAQNISTASFSVEAFAEKLAVSRSVLHKKIVSLAGEPPVEFIRRIRLNRAAELINKKFGNISEIALEVGFNNPAYFSESFKKQFGMTPSQYLQKNTNS